MRALVLGAGGREHALAWALVKDGAQVVSAPGNPGMAELGPCLAIDPTDPRAVLAACRDVKPDVVVVGPEAPLFAGVADALAPHVPVLGPRQADAQLEGSKAFAKRAMQAAGVPTAPFVVVEREAELDAALAAMPAPVVKADGPFLGKGVVVPESAAEARAAALRFLAHGPVVLEARLSGPELSLMALVGGGIALMPPARDHKRLRAGDQGPNTGGMGAVAPVADVAPTRAAALADATLRPLLQRHSAYRGVLYAGLMLTPDGPMVLEYNVRFGDPECQVLAPVVDGFGALLLRAASADLEDQRLDAGRAAVGVVLAADGYPDAPRRGDPIDGIARARSLPGVEVFVAGAAMQGGQLRTAGGRVLTVVGVAADVATARSRAYAGADAIAFADKQMREDIALQA